MVLQNTRSAERALAAASQSEMTRVTRQLEAQDRGAVGELWYRETFAPQNVDSAGDARPVPSPRRGAVGVIDLLDGDVIRELKNVAGGLDPGDRRQVQDLIGLINHRCRWRGRPRAASTLWR